MPQKFVSVDEDLTVSEPSAPKDHPPLPSRHPESPIVDIQDLTELEPQAPWERPALPQRERISEQRSN